eukprot:CAMPEP_0181298984 /NCGR_PEP_ID=MMETSP1101-20121128/6084_1 /TAXON_ID=46948 /ORGANISM="Rhodomonas abbreviata, Strain Caron Lab Isolate" /LENGTH=470 /DNA_ID=CAMNT_0023404063 /DNA_START=104 /DNA_END=1516 /DNA_ORIENTATION=-
MAVQSTKKKPQQPQESKELTQLRKKAAEGDAVAQNKLGDLCWDGLNGVEKNPETAFEWFSKAAEQGNTEAEYSVAFSLLSGQGTTRNPEGSVQWLEKAAEKGHPKAMRCLAQVTWQGMGCTQDTPKALVLWTKAAEAGDATAMAILGKLFSVGTEGIEKDQSKAVKYLRGAAEAGDADSMHLLGEALEKGEGCEVDEKEAMVWYKRAEQRGYISAQSQHSKGCQAFKEQKYGEAARCFMAAAKGKHPIACANLARFFYYGKGVEQDYAQALTWALQAVTLGEHDAALTVAMCHEYGHAVPADHLIGAQWYLYAMQHTDDPKISAQSMDALGRCAYKGSHHDYVNNHVPEDYSTAAYWWQRATDAGVRDAMNRLARLYYKGRGVAKDKEKAKQLWKQAAAAGSHEAVDALKDLEGYSLKEKARVYVPTLLVALLLLTIVTYFAIQYHEMAQDSWFSKMGDHSADTAEPAAE